MKKNLIIFLITLLVVKSSIAQTDGSLEHQRRLAVHNGVSALSASFISYSMVSMNFIGGLDDVGRGNVMLIGGVGVGINCIAIGYFVKAAVLTRRIKRQELKNIEE